MRKRIEGLQQVPLPAAEYFATLVNNLGDHLKTGHQ